MLSIMKLIKYDKAKLYLIQILLVNWRHTKHVSANV